MRSSRTLVLRKESLAELTPAELSDVAGAQATVPCPYTLGLCFVTRFSALLVNCPFGA